MYKGQTQLQPPQPQIDYVKYQYQSDFIKEFEVPLLIIMKLD